MLKTKLGPLGDSVGKLADEIFTGGIRTKEGADRMAALGPAGKAFENAVLAQKNATTQAQKDAAHLAQKVQEVFDQELSANLPWVVPYGQFIDAFSAR
jgi:hypothetical protein